MGKRIAFITRYNVLDSSTWPKHLTGISSAGYHLAKSLENQSFSLDYIGPLEHKYKFISLFKEKFYYKFFKKYYEPWADSLVVSSFTSQISRKLSTFNSDLVLCPENFLALANLECKQPIVIWTDTSLAGLINFYPWYSNLCDSNYKNIYAMEKAALDKSKLAIFASDWAAQTAINTYKTDPSKIVIVPWGANIECNRTDEDITSIVQSKSTDICKLLFVGVDWVRKGGETALAVTKELNTMGVNTELLVVGCEPITTEPLPSFVKVIGFVDKNTPEGANMMNKLYGEAHFLIMPSIAESYGHVLCEANSFGLPCIATKVGGIPTIIKDDFNGKTFSLNSGMGEYSDYIASIMSDYTEYKKLAHSSFNEYQSRLNWAAAGKSVKQLLMDI